MVWGRKYLGKLDMSDVGQRGGYLKAGGEPWHLTNYVLFRLIVGGGRGGGRGRANKMHQGENYQDFLKWLIWGGGGGIFWSFSIKFRIKWTWGDFFQKNAIWQVENILAWHDIYVNNLWCVKVYFTDQTTMESWKPVELNFKGLEMQK